jgi:hypothetical protein
MTNVPNLTTEAILPVMCRRTRRIVPILSCLLGLCLVIVLVRETPAAGNSKQIAVINREYEKTRSEFQAHLAELASSCDQKQLTDLARDIRQWAIPFEEQPDDVDKLPTQVVPDIPSTLPMPEFDLRVQVRKARVEYARKLYLLVKKSQSEKYASRAYGLTRELLFHDPDHKAARSLMGYKLAGDEWTTPFALRMKKEGRVWDDRFGWIPEKHLPRYEAGERFIEETGKWVTQEREAILRADFKNGWEIKTEHFFVKTNHSQEQGVALAAHVEQFHDYFMRDFAAFFQTPQQMAKLLTGAAEVEEKALHDINYFRTREEFVSAIIANCPVANEILGFYYPPDRIAHFFHNPAAAPEAALETLYHEVTHQLLAESSSQIIPVGNDRDFWVVEGLACYLESFQVLEDGTFSVGNIDHPRMQAARRQLVEDEEYEPLERFCLMGRLKFQQGQRPELQLRYAQATGLSHFFMNYKDGLYKDGFIEFMSQLYSPDQRVRSKAKPIYEILGVPPKDLDTQYVGYIKTMGPLE